MTILPSDEYWKKVGFEPKEVIGNIGGPKMRKGLEGWTTEDFQNALEYSKENEFDINGIPRASLPGLIIRHAPQTAKLLTILSRFGEDVSSYSVKKTLQATGIEMGGKSKQSMILEMFIQNPSLIEAIQIQSYASGLQRVDTFTTREEFNKNHITSKSFQEKLMSALSDAPSLAGNEIKLDNMKTKRGDPNVTFYIIHEDEKRLVRLINSSHRDAPVKVAVISFDTKNHGLEVRSHRKKVLDDIVKVVGSIIAGKEDAFLPIYDDTEGVYDLNNFKDYVLVDQVVRSVFVEESNLEGSPSIELSGLDITGAIKQLRDYKGIDLTNNVSGWTVRLSIKKDGVTKEFNVTKLRRKSKHDFQPPLSFDLKNYVYSLIKNGIIPKFV